MVGRTVLRAAAISAAAQIGVDVGEQGHRQPDTASLFYQS
jgi:hypothetical protein